MSARSGLRSYLDSFKKSGESDYMPEATGASLQDSPRLSRITVWIAAALIIVALLWAKFAVLDEVTVGDGKAIPSSKVQVIQNLEGGIVTELLVREGQMVNKGDTLLRLDDTRFCPTVAKVKSTVTPSPPRLNACQPKPRDGRLNCHPK